MAFVPDIQMLILLLAASSAFASVFLVVLPFLKRDERASRQRAIAQRRDELGREQREQLAQQRARARPQRGVTTMKRLLERFNLSNLTASPELRRKLVAAGWRHPSAVVTFVFARFAVALGAILFAVLFFLADRKFNLPFFTQAAIGLGAGFVGFHIPGVLVKNATQKRQQEMMLAFPDALDLLVICVQAGLSIEAAFSRVTEEIAEASSALSQEFGLTAAELAFLGDRSKAYANLAERTGLPAAKALTTALAQADKYGTPVGVALKILSDESRSERMSRAEQKGAALPAQLTVPMILFFLPVLFLVIIGPAVLQMLNI